MFILWFLLFVGWLVAEIAIFAEVGQAIGWFAAILLTLVTAAVGSVLLRVQGFTAMNRFLAAAEKGESPMGAVLDGMGIFAAGMLLVLPGFISDVLGLLLFIPPLRRGLIGLALRQVARAGPQAGKGPRRGPFRRPGEAAHGGLRKSDNVVDAEFETLGPDGKPQRPNSLPNNGNDGASEGDPNSPWRGR
jgi:UPF0716 protein FxsA